MRKKIAFLSSFIITGIFPLLTHAGVTTSAVAFKNPLNASSVTEVMVAFFDMLVQLGAVAVTLAIIYAGFLFVAAKGNPEELKKAKTTLFYTIIGALVLLGAQVIASIVETTLKKI
ncbi:MAG: hypothetical protein RLY49_105 [Candidatus Parcubacteria bacterium]|jgi:type II secretory pathway component PulF